MAVKKVESLNESKTGVDIHMFRHGFGDCFLLIFHDGPKPFTMMIDCGLLKGTPGEESRLAEVATCISELAPDKRIDVLVLSHPHYDHVSGFLPNRSPSKIFSKITFGQLWLPWTEDPNDLNATFAKKQHLLRVLALKAAIDLAGESCPIAPMLDFYGTRGSFDRSNLEVESELAIQTVRESIVKDQRNHRYWGGGQSTELPGTGGARVYFLGPQYPQEPSQPKPSDPAVYTGTRLAVSQEQARLIVAIEKRVGAHRAPRFLERFGIPRGATWEMSELSTPFAAEWRTPVTILEKQEEKPLPKTEQQRNEQAKLQQEAKRLREFVLQDTDLEPTDKRRGISLIETDVPLDLVLRLDESTNNTSLAMAIQLPRSGKVLLFPGDAQSKQWALWQDLSWVNETSDSKREISGKELLASTAFYKVSQRGSATGTSTLNGLNMLSPDLIAMLPIDESIARKRGWNLPFPQVFNALQATTRERVIVTTDKRCGEGEFDPKPTRLLGPRFVRVTIDNLAP